MKYFFFLTFLCSLLISCAEEKNTPKSEHLQGLWLGRLLVDEQNSVNFNFSVDSLAENVVFLTVINAEEKISCRGKKLNDSLWFDVPVFDASFYCKLYNDSITGKFVVKAKERTMDFVAIKSNSVSTRGYGTHNYSEKLNGRWRAKFTDGGDFSDAVGIFSINDSLAAGTFLTETGDYRFLQGTSRNDSLWLSCFDGSHAFLFSSFLDGDTLRGMFYSGAHYKDTFWAVKDDAFELRNPDSLTQFIGDSLKLAFSFSDLEGGVFNYPNEQTKNKIVLVQILGSWCPNCKDESEYFVSLKNKYKNLEIIGLCFETQKTQEGKVAQVKKMKDYLGINYPLLIAGNASKKESVKKFPFLNHVVSYPTTIVVDKTGKVRKVHTGFYGPGTGKYYEDFKKEFEEFLDNLLIE
ncbi:MAG: TlpA family protein disulfide reductase [Bacteroidia bacterium]